MEQIISVEKLNIIYHSEIRDKRNWNFKELIDEYIHKNICWKAGIANGNEAVSPIDKESAKYKKDNNLASEGIMGIRHRYTLLWNDEFHKVQEKVVLREFQSYTTPEQTSEF